MSLPSRQQLVSVAEQSEEQRGGRRSILSRQSHDHADLDALMHAYDAEPDAGKRGEIVAELAERALRHAFAEETVLFPAYRRHLPDDADLTAHIEGDHQQINEMLEQLQTADPQAPDYDALVREAFAVIRHDAHDEEDELLPRLQQVASPAQLRAIGTAWEASRRTSPTRPHPRIPRRPPGNALAGIPLAVSDRVKDGVDHVLPRGSRTRTVVLTA
ncbi:hemerythrin domain-containing protein, partial [Kineococcus rubinsiae]|uniref:hemerythrin domain-containing protein n=1 Tax=Kineococcus rubinsiae TaxID=2609562 RepID=UPI0014322F08